MRNNTDNINSQCRSGWICTRKLPIAFTLIEVLTVVLIISLLVAILLPSLKRAKDAARLGASKTSVNMIDAAVDMFENDHNELPPSTSGSGPPLNLPNNWRGAELICLLLTGYAGDPSTGIEGEPFDSGDMEDDDGKAGFGFRTNRRGKVYGPYNGTENLDIGESVGNNEKVFVDAFDNPILYYEYRGGYVASDNAGVYKTVGNGGPGDLGQTYLNNADDIRKDFILVSLGVLAQWPDDDKLDPEQPSNFGK